MSKPALFAAIRTLRGRTGAPVGAVKAALIEAGLDVDAAAAALRASGAAAAAVARAGVRTATDGGVRAEVLPSSGGGGHGQGRSVDDLPAAGVVVEVAAETDFVARTPAFGGVLDAVAEAAGRVLRGGVGGGWAWGGHCRFGGEGRDGVGQPGVVTIPPAALLAMGGSGGGGGGDGGDGSPSRGVAAALADASVALGEAIHPRRAAGVVAPPGGVVAAYIHGRVGTPTSGGGGGRIGVVVALGGDPLPPGSSTPPRPPPPELTHLAHTVAMHIAAAAPAYLSTDTIPPCDLAAATAAAAATPAAANAASPAIADRVVAGRLAKWRTEVVLEEQELLSASGEGSRVAEAVAAGGRDAGVDGLRVTAFVRYAVGEGDGTEGGGA
ncbi:hypothetical protein MMPV_007298 [Pyropia vietnamensis]